MLRFRVNSFERKRRKPIVNKWGVKGVLEDALKLKLNT